MQSFDYIQEPHSDALPRAKRPRHRPPSPLAMYQMAEYTPPPIQDPPPLAGTKSRPWIIFWNCFAALWAAGLIIWVIMIFRYGHVYALKSTINPIRNTTAYSVFVGAFVFTTLVSMVITFGSSPYWFVAGILLCGLGVTTGLIFETVVWQYQPFDCKNMGNKFPMYVTFNSENSPAATVYMHGSPLYDLAHESIDKWTYKTYISAEYLDWNTFLGKYVQQNPWPYQTGVTSITTKLLPKAGADGTIQGTCGDGSVCLEGKIWMRPNLEFHIKYTNPTTGVTTKTTLSSDVGAWYFGKHHRPLVSLHNRNGTEVFRAQSSETVCAAGDRSLETSLVPVGLMLIAERIYKTGV